MGKVADRGSENVTILRPIDGDALPAGQRRTTVPTKGRVCLPVPLGTYGNVRAPNDESLGNGVDCKDWTWR